MPRRAATSGGGGRPSPPPPGGGGGGGGGDSSPPPPGGGAGGGEEPAGIKRSCSRRPPLGPLPQTGGENGLVVGSAPAAPDVDAEEQEQPDHIDEVPVPGR